MDLLVSYCFVISKILKGWLCQCMTKTQIYKEIGTFLIINCINNNKLVFSLDEMFIILAIITVEMFRIFAHRKDVFIRVHIGLHSCKILSEYFEEFFLVGWFFEIYFFLSIRKISLI